METSIANTVLFCGRPDLVQIDHVYARWNQVAIPMRRVGFTIRHPKSKEDIVWAEPKWGFFIATTFNIHEINLVKEPTSWATMYCTSMFRI